MLVRTEKLAAQALTQMQVGKWRPPIRERKKASVSASGVEGACVRRCCPARSAVASRQVAGSPPCLTKPLGKGPVSRPSHKKVFERPPPILFSFLSFGKKRSINSASRYRGHSLLIDSFRLRPQIFQIQPFFSSHSQCPPPSSTTAPPSRCSASTSRRMASTCTS